MNQQSIVNDNKKDKKKKKKKKKGSSRTFGDNMRQLKFNLTTIRADLKFVSRTIFRELKYFIPLKDLFLLFIWIFIIITFFLIIVIWGVPLALSIIPGDPFLAWVGSSFGRDLTAQEIAANKIGLHINLVRWNGAIFNDLTLRWGAGIIGVGTVIIRLMIKSPILKYRDKVNTKKDVTYVFGTSRPAEQFLSEMIFEFGYEEKVSLIADVDLLWIRKLRALIDIYVVENNLEFEKPNLYEIIGFKNAKRIMILTESIELNQNILTNIRQVRPDVDIILLSQYAPAFVFSDLVQDENLIIIEDLDTTIQGLVLSLSMDFDFPPTVEIDVPRTYIGSTGVAMTSDLIKQKVLLIRRGEELLPPEETMQLGDRVILYYFNNYYMKLTNRVVTELPLRPKETKEKKKRKKMEKEMKMEKAKINGKKIPDTQIEIPTIEIPVVQEDTFSKSSEGPQERLKTDNEVD